MRYWYIILGVFILQLVGCDSDIDKKTVFEGEWIWLSTTGLEPDGTPIHRNPSTEGYEWKFNFYDEKGDAGKLQTYKDDVEGILYSYKFTSSDTPIQQKIDLTNLIGGSGLPETYYWEMAKSSSNTHLYLRNEGYVSDECCVLRIEHHFVLQEN
jgi:hypothetical protein